MEELASKLPSIRANLEKKSNFLEFYKWAYKFNCEPGQKTLKLDAALALTPLLLPPAKYPLVPAWLAFLESKGKTISRDTWAMIYQFFTTIHPDLSNYDADSGMCTRMCTCMCACVCACTNCAWGCSVLAVAN